MFARKFRSLIQDRLYVVDLDYGLCHDWWSLKVAPWCMVVMVVVVRCALDVVMMVY